MAAPLRLQLSCATPEVAVGEQILLTVTHEVFEDLSMETVVLNVSRTRLTIDRLDVSPPQRVLLDGSAHVALHRVPFRRQVGTLFHAPAGSRWDDPLNLLDFARPLAAGRYRIGLRYRWGDGPRDIVDAGPVEVTCRPSHAAWVSRRWIGEPAARSELELLWGAGGSWIYSVADGRDPSVLRTSVDLRMEGVQPSEAPLLAQLNAVPENVFDRHALWLEGGRLRHVRFSYVGRMDPPHDIALDVSEAERPRLSDPPIQRGDLGCAALVALSRPDGSGALRLVDIDREGRARHSLLSYDGPALESVLVQWRLQPERLGVAYGLTSDRRRLISVDLESGAVAFVDLTAPPTALRMDPRAGGRLYGCVENDKRIVETLVWPAELADGRVVGRYDLAKAPPSARLVDLTESFDRTDVTLLFVHEDGAFGLRAGLRYVLPQAETAATPWLAAGRKGTYAMTHTAERGFAAILVDVAAPEPPI